MNLSRKWLHEYVDVSNISDKDYAAALTMSGSKVEAVEVLGEEITNVITGKITKIERHPDADKLVVCQVDINRGEEIQIVTGAENIREGDIVPIALDKSTLPGGVKITKGKLRGQISNGMMCSYQELGFTEHNFPDACTHGILVLDPDTEIGVDIHPIVGLDDSVVEFEITSNRPDCLSAIGLARETAATFGVPCKIDVPCIKNEATDETIADYISVKVADADLCPRYMARVVRDIKIAPSPKWLREKLHACGVRPISNIVDITNYVMLEYGQPMHAFDYACIDGKAITVRRALDNEVTTTLDSQVRKLDSDMLVIADDTRAIGIAGVMGGENSEITDTTKTVVFESAVFNGPSIRITAKKVGLRTEASARYEKGLDPINAEAAVNRACELVELLGAGTVVSGVIDVKNFDEAERTMPLDADAINKLLGTDVSKEDMIEYLERLDFKIENDVITVPSFRADVERMCDVAEEVARIYGYDNIPTTLYAGETVLGALSDKQKFNNKATELCRSVGFSEAVTHSFISPKFYDKINLPKEKAVSTTILNPLGEDFSVMRTTSLPSMLDAVAHNYSYRNATCALYEMATIYTPNKNADGTADATTLPKEEIILTFGTYNKDDFFSFKGKIVTVLAGLGVQNLEFKPESGNTAYHPGRCATIYSGDTFIGTMGAVHPNVAKNFGMSGEILAAQLVFDAIYEAPKDEVLYKSLPKFPNVTRDIALVCDDSVLAGDLEKCIKEASGNILKSVKLFDVYKGAQLGENKKSLAFALTFGAKDRTLTDEECDKSVSKVLASAEKLFAAILR